MPEEAVNKLDLSTGENGETLTRSVPTPATGSPSGTQRFILRDWAKTATPTKCWG